MYQVKAGSLNIVLLERSLPREARKYVGDAERKAQDRY